MQNSDVDHQFKVCVFAASSDQVDTTLLALAETLGAELVTHGFAVVYGGTTQGCMGRLAAAVSQRGGTLIGVVPRALRDLAFDPLSQLFITDDLHDRQREFERLSDAFIALPGGVGTVAEVFSVINARLLGMHSKPLVLLNAQGSSDPILRLLQTLVHGRFAADAVKTTFSVVRSVSSAVRFIERASKTTLPPITSCIGRSRRNPEIRLTQKRDTLT